MSLKSLFISILFIIYAGIVSADNVVRYPSFESSTTPEFKIDSIVFKKDKSLFYFHYDNREGTYDWININSETHLRDSNGKIYPIQECINIERSPNKTYLTGKREISGIISFPFIHSENIKSIDFIENENTISFNIIGIDISRDGENIGYVDFLDFNRKQNMADFYFSAKNYEKYIQLATPLLPQARSAFGKNGVIAILPKLIDSYVLTGNKNEIYYIYLDEYRKICKSQGWQDNLTCSIELSADMAVLANQIYELHSQNKIKEACILMEEYLPKARLIYSEKDSTYAFNNIIYSDMLKELSDIDHAIEAKQKSVEEYKKTSNRGMVYQTTLGDLARMYEQNGNIEKAIDCYRELYDIENEIGYNYTFKHAQTGYLLGNIYLKNKRYDEGVEVLLDVHNLYSSVDMKIDSIYLSVTNALSITYYNLQNFDDAISIWEKTTTNIKKRIGKNNFLYFNSVSNLADRCRVSYQIGRAAEEIYEIKENLKNKRLTKDYISGLCQLANVLSGIGDKKSALVFFLNVKQISEESSLENTISYEYLLFDLASTYRDVNDTINCAETCNTILQKAFGTDEELSFDLQIKNYAKLTLAQLYQTTDPELSASLCKEILNEENTGSIFNEDTKTSAMQHIRLLKEMFPNHKQIIQIYNETNIENQIDVTDEIGNTTLNLLQFAKGAMSADDMKTYVENNKHLINVVSLRTIFDNLKDRILSNMLFLTETERETYYNESIHFRYNPLWLCTISEETNIEELNSIIYDFLLMTKSILLTSSNGLGEIVYKSNRKDLIDKYNRIKNNTLSENESIEQLEREVIKEVRSIEDFTNNLYISWKDVKQSLNDNEIALEFYTLPLNDGKKSYGVVMLRNDWEFPKIFNLSMIEEAIQLYGFERMSNIWNLLMSKGYINRGDNVYMSGAGILQLKPFEHLVVDDENDIRFSDLCNVIRVTSTREIVRQKSTHKVPLSSIVLFGGLDYTADNIIVNLPEATKTHNTLRGDVDEHFRSGFDNLQFTHSEVEGIKNIAKQNNVQCRIYKGKLGTEQEVKNLSGENIKILHFATHGKYLSDNTDNNYNDNPYKSLLNGTSLNRSFLVMAGGNALPTHKERTTETDGLLTSEEISALDLHNIEIVVLSACKSAQGDLSDEGVMGLQYGFKKAGVKSILMCLDNIDDEATQHFMIEFYKQLFSGISPHDSLSKAQKYLRTVNNGKYQSEAYWGNFILLDAIQ